MRFWLEVGTAALEKGEGPTKTRVHLLRLNLRTDKALKDKAMEVPSTVRGPAHRAGPGMSSFLVGSTRQGEHSLSTAQCRAPSTVMGTCAPLLQPGRWVSPGKSRWTKFLVVKYIHGGATLDQFCTEILIKQVAGHLCNRYFYTVLFSY